MLLPPTLAFGVLGVLAFFGVCVGVMLLREREGVAVLGYGAVLGYASYMVLTNALGHVLPVWGAFSLTLLALGVMGASLLSGRSAPRIWPLKLTLPKRSVLLSFLAVLLIASVANLRFLGSDPWSWLHFPLAKTIAEGNFPPVELPNPDQALGYHYGAALMASALHALTGVSLFFGFAPQPVIGVIGILCFSYVLLRRLKQPPIVSLLGALLALGGTGLTWLKGGALLEDLFRAIVLQEDITSPFRNLVPTFSSPFTSSLLMSLGHRSFALGYPFLFALLYLLQGAFDSRTPVPVLRWQVIFGVVLALALALTMEIALVLLVPAILLYSITLRLCQGSWKGVGRVAVVSLLIFLPALVLAKMQGGVLTTPTLGDASAFSVGFDGTFAYDTRGFRTGIFDPTFLRDMGLPLLLFPFTATFFWQRRRILSPFPLLLALLALIALLLPFLVHYQVFAGELKRLFPMFLSFSSLLSMLFLFEVFLRKKNLYRKTLGSVGICAMLLASILYLPTRLLFPTLRMEQSPLLPSMPVVASAEAELFSWVRAHTKLSDRFYHYVLLQDLTEVSQDIGLQKDRILFMIETGRYSVGPLSMWNYPERFRELSRVAEERCQEEAFQELQVRYLVVHTKERRDWFLARCPLSEWVLRYDGGEGGYPRIYERST